MSTEFTITMSGTKETTPPSVPANLNASDVTATSFILNWTASTDNDMVLGYEVYKDGNLYGTTKSTDTKLIISNLSFNKIIIMIFI